MTVTALGQSEEITMAQKVSSPIEVYEGAVQQLLPTLAGVRSDQLGSSTPCTEWTV